MSSFKRILEPFTLLSAESMGASFSSPATSFKYMDRVMLHITTTGTPTGTLSVQTSINGQTGWEIVPLGMNPLAGVNDDYVIDMQVTALPFLRINYVRTSGTGTCTAVLSGKES